MKLLLIRHGDPDYNNDTLSPLGHDQARLLADYLRNDDINAILSSPMGRARLTADYLSGTTGMPFIIQLWLHELDGNFKDNLWAWNIPGNQMLTKAEIMTSDNWPEHVIYGNHMESVISELNHHFDKFMTDQGYTRDGPGFQVNIHNTNTIILCCHEGVILALLSCTLNIPLPIVFAHFKISPSSRTVIELEEQGDNLAIFKLVMLNDMGHMQQGFNA